MAERTMSSLFRQWLDEQCTNENCVVEVEDADGNVVGEFVIDHGVARCANDGTVAYVQFADGSAVEVTCVPSAKDETRH
jgi:hypothetical protein